MALIAIDWNPKPRSLRQFAVICGVFCTLVVGFVWLRQGDSTVMWTVGTLGVAIGVLGTLWPETVRYVYVGMMVITFPVGWVMSHLVLGLIYYGVFTPVALFFRLMGRDALQRRIDPAAATYWQPRAPAPPVRRYLRQF